MASEKLTVTIGMKLPLWWRLYVGALNFFHDMGVLRVDASIAASFIVRHTKFYIK